MLSTESISFREAADGWNAYLNGIRDLSVMPAGFFLMPVSLSGLTADYIMLPLLSESRLLCYGAA